MHDSAPRAPFRLPAISQQLWILRKRISDVSSPFHTASIPIARQLPMPPIPRTHERRALANSFVNRSVVVSTRHLNLAVERKKATRTPPDDAPTRLPRIAHHSERQFIELRDGTDRRSASSPVLPLGDRQMRHSRSAARRSWTSSWRPTRPAFAARPDTFPAALPVDLCASFGSLTSVR